MAPMTDLSGFAITRKWPAQHPDRIQLYSLPTPNGVKVSILLEETGLPYEPHLVRFDTNDQLTAEFLSLNPTTRSPPSWTRTARAGSRWRCLSRARSLSIWPKKRAVSSLPMQPAATRRCNG